MASFVKLAAHFPKAWTNRQCAWTIVNQAVGMCSDVTGSDQVFVFFTVIFKWKWRIYIPLLYCYNQHWIFYFLYLRKRRLQRNILTNQTILNPALVIAQKPRSKNTKKTKNWKDKKYLWILCEYLFCYQFSFVSSSFIIFLLFEWNKLRCKYLKRVFIFCT